ncbi:hypothetical protein ABZV14_34785 [Streptosporangium canum]|uniref:hypothetical protein n=1 Tax=Streptosporangium TaxID=2000 RepID=UPI0012DF55A6|nr:hypothetical protein [Streptosporangium roseum]
MSSHVMVEVLMLRLDGSGGFGYRRAEDRLAGGTHPDEAARVLADAGEILLHSTSWRYDDQGHIVLTYAACPDPHHHLPAVPVVPGPGAVAAAPDRPSPPTVTVDDVAAHALRHLAWLSGSDPVTRAFVSARPDLATALARHAPAPAGRI